MVSGNLCMASMLWCPGIATPPRGQAWFLVPAPYLLHPFIHWWTLILHPCLEFCKYVAISPQVCVSLQVSVFVSFRYIPRNVLLDHVVVPFLIS